jgi:glucose-6-phosphate 1-epimerase
LRDLGDQEWKRMVCVEVCNVREAAVRLGPGESHTMTATFELLPVLPQGSASS